MCRHQRPGRFSNSAAMTFLRAPNDFQFSDGVIRSSAAITPVRRGDPSTPVIRDCKVEIPTACCLANGSHHRQCAGRFRVRERNFYVSNHWAAITARILRCPYAQDEFKLTRNLVDQHRNALPGDDALYCSREHPNGRRRLPRAASTFIPGHRSRSSSMRRAGLLYPGDPGISEAGSHTDKNDCGPRVGLAWDLFGTGRRVFAPPTVSSTPRNRRRDGSPGFLQRAVLHQLQRAGVAELRLTHPQALLTRSQCPRQKT